LALQTLQQCQRASAAAHAAMPLVRSATQQIAAEATVGQVVLGCLISLPPSCVFWWFEWRVLIRYLPEGANVFSYNAEPVTNLTGNCNAEWSNLHLTMIVTMLFWVLHSFAQILGATKPCGGILAGLAAVADSVVSLTGSYFSIKGIIIVGFKWNKDDVAQCEDLHNTCWWIYIGMLLIAIGLGCCLCVAAVGIMQASKASARERANAKSPTVSVSDLPNEEGVQYAVLPGQPA